MGKRVVFLLTIFVFACQNSTYYIKGFSEVSMTMNSKSDTLRGCFCWNDHKSTYVSISNDGYESIEVRISQINNSDFVTRVKEWADTNMFDGESNRELTINAKKIDFIYQITDDSLNLIGNIDITCNDTIRLKGKFYCPFSKDQ